MPPGGFELTIAAGERPQTYALDRAVTGIELNALIYQNYFWNIKLRVSDSSSVHHQEFFTVHTAMVYVIQVCLQLASRIRIELSSVLILLASCKQTCMSYTIAVYSEKLLMMDRGTVRNTRSFIQKINLRD